MTVLKHAKRIAPQAKADLSAAIEKRRLERLHTDLAAYEMREAIALATRLLRDEHEAAIFSLAEQLVESGKLNEVVRIYRDAHRIGMTLKAEE